jgi:hypothetical protein
MGQDQRRLERDARYAPFLHNAVGEDTRGASVTVLSMLARLGVDPWQEAAELAALPAAAARQRLGMLVARFADVPSAGPARVELVSRLLSFLPRKAAAPGTAGNGSVPMAAAPAAGTILIWLIGLAALLVLVVSLGRGS